MLTFGAGAVVGGLLTWGIMEWADNDDWDDYHHVGHYYGNTVCRNGNCWHGGGGGYYGDRGNVNVNRNTNIDRSRTISGNEVNIDRGGNFSQNSLKPTQRPAGWQPDQRHRRGQAYPEAVQKRLGQSQQPALAGQRLGAAQTLPASARGFAEAGQRPAAGTLPAERRPSSADIRERLAQKPGAQDKFANKLSQPKPATRDVQERLGQGSRDNALQGIKTRVRPRVWRAGGGRKAVNQQHLLLVTFKPVKPQVESVSSARRLKSPGKPQWKENHRSRSGKPRCQNKQSRSQAAGRERTQQQRDIQRRSEAAKPNAFEGSRNARATQMSSQRGAVSQQRSANAGNIRAQGASRPSGGGGLRGGGGQPGGGGLRAGGGGRPSGGGMRAGGGGRPSGEACVRAAAGAQVAEVVVAQGAVEVDVDERKTKQFY